METTSIPLPARRRIQNQETNPTASMPSPLTPKADQANRGSRGASDTFDMNDIGCALSMVYGTRFFEFLANYYIYYYITLLGGARRPIGSRAEAESFVAIVPMFCRDSPHFHSR